MKINLVRVSILALGAAAAAFAQGPNTLRVNVPFEFNVDGSNMPAGQYVVDLNKPGLIYLHGVDARVNTIAIAVAAQSAYPPNESKLLFHRYGDQYFLWEALAAGGGGREIPRTRQERNLAQIPATPANVTIAAKR